MPLQATSGAASYDAFGGGVPVVPNYIEEVFSTYLYTGNGSTQTITNGIDFTGKGGMALIKRRSSDEHPTLFDTARGDNRFLYTNQTVAEYNITSLSFNSNGFTMNNRGDINYVGETYASWTFRKQPKFFDVLTYTGTGSNTTIAHNLGSVPGCIIVKRTDANADWAVYHRSLTDASYYLRLNLTSAEASNTNIWNSTAPTSTVFTVGSDNRTNASGGTYVAYLFAHDAGGFGLTGTDNVISCGTFTDSGADQSINLGYEPQWVLVKRTSSSGDWWLVDNMRGMPVGSVDATLKPNTADAEQNAYSFINPEATGFRLITGQISSSGQTFIYIAIRRPMKVPTSGTSVFAPVVRAGTSSNITTTSIGFPPDLVMSNQRTAWAGGETNVFDRLRGPNIRLLTNATSAESTAADSLTGFDAMTGVRLGIDSATGVINYLNGSDTYINWNFRRAPSFFDQGCFDGPTSGSTTQTHNLAVVPELMIVRPRSVGSYWYVYSSLLGISKYLSLNLNDAQATSSNFWVTAPTSTAFTCSVDNMGSSGANRPHVAYLFATCAGVSKVFSYTGNGSSQTINCGFTGGARFVLIKRTDSTGDWYVWDSARGIVSGNDPHLSLNTTAAEVTSNDTIDTDSTGFVVNQVSATNVNVSSATYIGLAIA